MDKLNLKPAWIVFPKVNIEAYVEHDTDEDVEDLRIDLGSDTSQDEEHMIHTTISLSNLDYTENNLPYKIDVSAYASFYCNRDIRTLSDKFKREVTRDISSMVLGSLREFISTVTSRGPWGTYIVPFLSVEDLADSILEDLTKDESLAPKSK